MPILGDDQDQTTLYGHDTFDRADGALGTSDSGHAWSVVAGTAAIASGKAVLGSESMAVLASVGQSDVRVEADVTMGGQCGIVFRYGSTNNYWRFLRLNADNYLLQKRVAGTVTNMFPSDLGFPAPANQMRRMGVACHGPNITLLLDGAPVGGVVDSALMSNTQYGVNVADGSAGGGSNAFDRFVVDSSPMRHRRPWSTAAMTSGSPQLALREHDTLIAGLASIANATSIREQDGIVYDPADANAARRYKLYFTVYRTAGVRVHERELWAMFSADGATFSAPEICTTPRSVEDPSVVTHVDIDKAGLVVRDSSSRLMMYAEHATDSRIYGYVSSDGITWTDMANNPAVPHVGDLEGSPIARHDGQRVILGYEVIDTAAPKDEHLYIATGQPGALTPSPNNPVWSPQPDRHAENSIVCDTIQRDTPNGQWIFLAHNGQAGATASRRSLWRARTTVMDPDDWTEGDIRTVGGNISGTRSDITPDASDPTRSRVVLTKESTGRMFRAYLTAQ